MNSPKSDTRVKIDVELAVPSHPDWVQVIVDNFDEFLQDHANCERKAVAQAMGLAMRHPERLELIPHLIRLAQEELEHFAEVYALMEARGLPLVREIKDPYVNGLLEHCRTHPEERFLDRMLISSIIEARGAERFALVADALTDPELKAFYRRLWAAERKHGHLFVNQMLHYFSEEVIRARLNELLIAEGELIQRLEWRPSLH
ncbi:MAG TPA: tRNA-(ms[2]io[6]A)-hydroxylase [Candidatus Obscuribacterales bacterium]